MKLIQNEKGEFVKVPLTEAELAALQPSPYELAMQDWHEPKYPLRIKASVEILNPTHPQAVQIHMFYNYMKAQRLPEHTENGIKYVYVNEIDPAHQEFFDLLQEVESEKRPEPEDFNTIIPE